MHCVGLQPPWTLHAALALEGCPNSSQARSGSRTSVLPVHLAPTGYRLGQRASFRSLVTGFGLGGRWLSEKPPRAAAITADRVDSLALHDLRTGGGPASLLFKREDDGVQVDGMASSGLTVVVE